MTTIINVDCSDWDPRLSHIEQQRLVKALESGAILFFPTLAFSFQPQEQSLLHLTPLSSKNISFNSTTKQVHGVKCSKEENLGLQNLMLRYKDHAKNLVLQLFPQYAPMKTGMTSFRTKQAAGRPSASYRKDDSRLHVDSFPSRPVAGKRLLRVFCNVNPGDVPRVWKAGEPFENVAKKFLPHTKKYSKWLAKLRFALRITKSFQTEYDHLMLQLHHNMKADMEYQRTVSQQECHFPPGSVWIVFSDQVSHAVLSGQHMMEQTFYLPVEAMVFPDMSPLHVLQRLTAKILV